jgi:hypothetical protein
MEKRGEKELFCFVMDSKKVLWTVCSQDEKEV